MMHCGICGRRRKFEGLKLWKNVSDVVRSRNALLSVELQVGVMLFVEMMIGTVKMSSCMKTMVDMGIMLNRVALGDCV